MPNQKRRSPAKGGDLTFYATGDVMVNRKQPKTAFALVAPTIKQGDIAFCQLEQLLSKRGARQVQMGFAPPPIDPGTASVYRSVGFSVISCAGNHCLDWGDDALLDTIDSLKKGKLQVIGVGKDIVEARKPVIVEKKGVKVGFLAYNSILPQRFWADVNKPGCAPLRVNTLYEPEEPAQPGAPCRILTFPNRQDFEAMLQDIKGLRAKVDIVMVSLHWGLHFAPGLLAGYQKEVGHAAIDAGADIIIGHHAHILKGIEVYKGKVITYSLGNFVIDLGSEWLNRPAGQHLIQLYPNLKGGLDPEYPTFPFPVDSRKTLILKCIISGGRIERVSFLPAYINKQGQPEIQRGKSARGRDVFNYMNDMSKALGTKLSVQGDEVLIST